MFSVTRKQKDEVKWIHFLQCCLTFKDSLHILTKSKCQQNFLLFARFSSWFLAFSSVQLRLPVALLVAALCSRRPGRTCRRALRLDEWRHFHRNAWARYLVENSLGEPPLDCWWVNQRRSARVRNLTSCGPAFPKSPRIKLIRRAIFGLLEILEMSTHVSTRPS